MQGTLEQLSSHSRNEEEQTALTQEFFLPLQGPLHFCFTLQVNKDVTLEERKVQLSIMWGTHTATNWVIKGEMGLLSYRFL